jgi:hypothetical protein
MQTPDNYQDGSDYKRVRQQFTSFRFFIGIKGDFLDNGKFCLFSNPKPLNSDEKSEGAITAAL